MYLYIFSSTWQLIKRKKNTAEISSFSVGVKCQTMKYCNVPFNNEKWRNYVTQTWRSFKAFNFFTNSSFSFWIWILISVQDSSFNSHPLKQHPSTRKSNARLLWIFCVFQCYVRTVCLHSSLQNSLHRSYFLRALHCCPSVRHVDVKIANFDIPKTKD